MDARFVDHKGKKVWAVCVAEEAIPRLYIKSIDKLGGWSKDLELTTKKLVDARAKDVLRRMQKAKISRSLNI